MGPGYKTLLFSLSFISFWIRSLKLLQAVMLSSIGLN